MTNSHHYQNQVAQDRFGLQVGARLSEAAADLPYDISERLRAARVQAVAKRRVATARTATSMTVSGGTAALTFGSDNLGWFGRFAAVVPLLALVLGLVTIHFIQTENRTAELAEVDVALLSDTLPPEAYTDPGFLQFLKTHSAQNF